MSELPPVVLIASASAYERRRMRCKLLPTRGPVQDVSSAEQAARFCDDNRKTVILLIDGGLLAETASPEWRTLRERYPEIGAVVRSLIPRGSGIVRPDPTTILVHPDDTDGLQEALRLLRTRLARDARARARRGRAPRAATSSGAPATST